MNPAAIILIIQGIQAAIQLAPQIASIVENGKSVIDGLVAGKVITVEQQEALKAHIDGISAMAKTGLIPPHWQVEPYPAVGT